MPTFTKHESGVLYNGGSGAEPWVGFVVYAGGTHAAQRGKPAVVSAGATTSWVKIDKGHSFLNLGVCQEDANTGNRLSVGCGGFVTYLQFYNTVSEDDFIHGAWGSKEPSFNASTASQHGDGWICGIAKQDKTTEGWGSVKCWMFPWRI